MASVKQETLSAPGTCRSCRSRAIAPANAPLIEATRKISVYSKKPAEYGIGKSSILMLCVQVDVFFWYEK